MRPVLVGLTLALFAFPKNAPSQSQIIGQIMDVTHQPVAGAKVFVIHEGTEKIAKSVRSDAGGQFELEKIPPGQYYLCVTLWGYESFRSEPIESGATAQDVGILIIWEKPTRSVLGKKNAPKLLSARSSSEVAACQCL